MRHRRRKVSHKGAQAEPRGAGPERTRVYLLTVQTLVHTAGQAGCVRPGKNRQLRVPCHFWARVEVGEDVERDIG
jgi:hypothetical protein